MTTPVVRDPAPQTVLDLADGRERGSVLARPQYGQQVENSNGRLPGWYVSISTNPFQTTPRPTVRLLERMLGADGRAVAIEQALTLPLRGAQPLLGGGTDASRQLCRDLLLTPLPGRTKSLLGPVTSAMASATWQRKSYHEIVWGIANDSTGTARATPVKIAPRAVTAWTDDRDAITGDVTGIFGDVPFRTDKNEIDYRRQVINSARLIRYVHGAHRDPLEGQGDLDISYSIWQTKAKLRFLWLEYLADQAFGRTVVIAPPPSEASPGAEPAQLAAQMHATRGGGTAGLPGGTTVQALAFTGSAQFQSALDYCDNEMATSALAGFLALHTGGSAHGSLALSKDATDLFTSGRESVLTEMADCLTDQLLVPLVRWNLGDSVACPTLSFAPLATADQTATIALYTALITGAVDRAGDDMLVALSQKVEGYLELNLPEQAQRLVARAQATQGTPPTGASGGTLAPAVDAQMHALAVARAQQAAA